LPNSFTTTKEGIQHHFYAKSIWLDQAAYSFNYVCFSATWVTVCRWNVGKT